MMEDGLKMMEDVDVRYWVLICLHYILLLWCIDWTASLIPVLVCTLHIINHASLEHGINAIAAANKAPEGVYLVSKQKIGYDFWNKKLQPRKRKRNNKSLTLTLSSSCWYLQIYIYIYIHMIYVYSQSLSGQTFGRFEMEVFASKELPPFRRLSVGRKLWRDVMGGEVKHVSLT